MTRAVLVGLALAAVAPAGAQAPPPAPARIGVVAFPEVPQRTPGDSAAESPFTPEGEGVRREGAPRQQQMDSAVQAFDQQSIALSPAARTQKQRELQQLQQRIEQRTGELQQRAGDRERELLRPIQARVESVIQGMRAELNLSAVFDAGPNNGVVAFDPALDLTARVLERLQRSQ